MDSASESRSFSVFDLLAVMVILVLVAWVLVPALFNAQVVSRGRTPCQNNLRSLVLACHNMHDTHGCIAPFDSRATPGDNPYYNAGGNYGSVFFYLLPFLEQAHLYEEAAFQGQTGWSFAVSVVRGSREPPSNYEPGPPQLLSDYSVNPPEENTLLTAVVKGFICPSDPTAKAGKYLAPNGWGGCSYGANFLVFGNSTPADLNDPDGQGGSHRPGKWGFLAKIPESFPDGTSNTILFTERYVSCNDGAAVPPGPGPTMTAPSRRRRPWNRPGTMGRASSFNRRRRNATTTMRSPGTRAQCPWPWPMAAAAASTAGCPPKPTAAPCNRTTACLSRVTGKRWQVGRARASSLASRLTRPTLRS
jgi:hypothetical protein